MTEPKFASPVDTEKYGEYKITRIPGDERPLYRFTGRITADGSSGFKAEPGRYHLYSGWFCPWAQRTIIQRALNGLEDVVSVSYVDGKRDGRGWAFREPNGVDPVNGFLLLRDAYEITEPGFDGHVSVPTLWDRVTGRIVSNDFPTIGIDLATQFTQWSNGTDTYPVELQADIAELDSWIGPAVNWGVNAAASDESARTALLGAFAELEKRLETQRFLLGSDITEADVRLFVSLARFDTASNAEKKINGGLAEFPNLWAYARDLYQHPAFRETTVFASFSRPGVTVPDWDAPQDRELLSAVSV